MEDPLSEELAPSSFTAVVFPFLPLVFLIPVAVFFSVLRLRFFAGVLPQS